MAKRHVWVNWLAGCFFLGAALSARGSDTTGIINGWLARQTNVQTWTADFTQTRNLKSLAQPLVSTGQVWFAAPHNFRWELGGNQTIAIRKGENMLVVYPRLKRAERYDFENSKGGHWRDTLALLQTGFPRSEQELRQQFNILGISPEEGLYQLALQPKSPSARKMMPQINVFISRGDLTLAGTELVFADESRMRNDFRDIKTNVNITGQFEYELPPEFKLVEPLEGR